MHLIDAKIRHRELTQAVYDIGDEVVDYIEHLIEAMKDWDIELVEDCWAEFEEIVEEARNDSRRAVAELAGVRQALTSGLRSGTVSVRQKRAGGVDKPKLPQLDELPDAPTPVDHIATTLHARADQVIATLEQSVEWVLDRTAVAADDLDALSLPVLYSRTHRLVNAATQAWIDTARSHPEFARGLRGTQPPKFLAERARIDAVVAKVIAKKAQAS